jgi:L-lactate utilization protein LutB
LFDGWKEQLKADIALKNGARFYFCKNIEEAEEVIEESMVEKVD